MTSGHLAPPAHKTHPLKKSAMTALFSDAYSSAKRYLHTGSIFG